MTSELIFYVSSLKSLKVLNDDETVDIFAKDLWNSTRWLPISSNGLYYFLRLLSDLTISVTDQTEGLETRHAVPSFSQLQSVELFFSLIDIDYFIRNGAKTWQFSSPLVLSNVLVITRLWKIYIFLSLRKILTLFTFNTACRDEKAIKKFIRPCYYLNPFWSCVENFIWISFQHLLKSFWFFRHWFSMAMKENYYKL